MKIINYTNSDYCGLAMYHTKALQKHTEHEVRTVARLGRAHYRGYPADIVSKDPAVLSKWIDWADVVNCHGVINVLKKKPKNLMVTYRGSHFRGNPKGRYQAALNAGAKKQVVGGAWMCHYGGLDLEWLPPALPVDDWLKMKRSHEGKPIVCQTPRSFISKNTVAIKEKIEKMNNFTLKIVTGVSWNKCMAAKADADLYIGSFKRGYGISPLEAMAMKIPVITHAKFEESIIEKVGYLPFYSCELEELPDAINALLSDKKLYNKYAMLCFNYVKEFHDYPVVAKKYSKMVDEVLNM